MNLTPSPAQSLPRYLVLGYGNTLRQDDGVGYRIAETIAAWDLQNVRSLALHQLTPDLAAEIADATTVIFVDAVAVAAGGDASTLPLEIMVESLEANPAETFTGHHIDPRSLLLLSQSLYGAMPIAYRILIPAIDFSFGETFSSLTQTSFFVALEKIKELICISLVQFGE